MSKNEEQQFVWAVPNTDPGPTWLGTVSEIEAHLVSTRLCESSHIPVVISFIRHMRTEIRPAFAVFWRSGEIDESLSVNGRTLRSFMDQKNTAIDAFLALQLALEAPEELEGVSTLNAEEGWHVRMPAEKLVAPEDLQRARRESAERREKAKLKGR